MSQRKMPHNYCREIADKLKDLDATEVCFIEGFSTAFKKEHIGIYLGLQTLEKTNLNKQGYRIWKEAYLLGKLLGETECLLIKDEGVDC